MPANNGATFPIAPLTTSGSTYTVDYFLNSPKIIARDIIDIAREGFWTGQVFDMGVTTDNGSLTFESVPAGVNSDLYLERDVQKVAPLTPAPIVTGIRGDITTVGVETWAGKYPISDEARRRNDLRSFQRQQTQLGNTMARKMEIRGVETLDAAVTANSRSVAAPATLSSLNATQWNVKTDLTNYLAPYSIAQASANKEERGITYDTLILSPDDKVKYGYGLGWGNVDEAFGQFGLNVVTSNRVAAGSAYLVKAGAFGGFGWELQPTIRTYDDRNIRGTWVEGEAAFVPYVDNAFAIYKVTGL